MDRRKTAAALALAGLCGHAFFLPVSIAGMQIALAVAALGVLLDPPLPLRTPLDLPALAFVLVAVASDLFSPVGAPPLAEATLWRSLFGFFVVTHALRLCSRRSAQEAGAWIVACAAVGLLAASLVGLVQYKTGFDPVHMLGLREEPALVQAPGVAGRYGAMGFFTSRLTFGHNAVLLLSLLVGAIASGALPRKVAMLAGVTSLTALAAVAVTFDRAAYLALGIAAIALVARSRSPKLGALLAGAGVLSLLHPGVRARLLTAFSGAANSDRVFIWARARDHRRSSLSRHRIRQLPSRVRRLLRPRRSAFPHADVGPQPGALHLGRAGAAGPARARLAPLRRLPAGAAEREPLRAGRPRHALRLAHHRAVPRRHLRHQGHVRAVVRARAGRGRGGSPCPGGAGARASPRASAASVARITAGQSWMTMRSTEVRKSQSSGCGCSR